MRVFLAGATGVLGRRLVPALLEAGHQVTGMTRSPERAEALRAAGVEPAVCDAFDAAGVRAAVASARPAVVLDELTDIPAAINPRRYAADMAGNDRLRREATPALVDAAVAAGAHRVIAQSVAFFYDPAGPAIKHEDDPVYARAPNPLDRSVAALGALESAVTGAAGVEGLVLRYGFLYGPGTIYAPDGSTAAMVRRRRFPLIGRGDGVTSFVHVDDAASATVAALDRGAPGIYNIVDDDPAPARVWLPEYAALLGAAPPRRVPRWVARLVAGPVAVLLADARGASNAKAKGELGWQPRYPSWRQGFREALG